MPDEDSITSLREIAEKIKSTSSSDIDIVDVGDVEVIKVGEDILASLPKGKDVWFINRSKFPTMPIDIKKLSEVVE
jgi:hypothetical protein